MRDKPRPGGGITARDDWEVFDEPRRLLGGAYGTARVRMFAFGLADGGLCVVSPGTDVDEARFQALERWGEPRFLLAPNKYHNAGIMAWKQRYPRAIAVTHPRALARLRKRLPDAAFEGLEALEAALPEGTRLFSPAAKQGETLVSVKIDDGSVWFVTDAIMNQNRLPSGPMGWLLRIVGFRTGLARNPLFERLFVDNRAAYRQWLRGELARDPPTVFIPSHGAVLRGPDVVSRLLALFPD